MTETFNFPGKTKKLAIGLMIIGLIGLVVGFIVYHEHTNRVWANILLNSYYFLGISLAGVFLTAVHQVGYGAWHIPLKRVFEATGTFIPVAGIGVIVLLIGAWASGGHHFIYHWMDPEVYDPASPHYDKILAGKHSYLNLPFFSFRIIVYLFLWTLFAVLLRRVSIKEDEIGGLKTYKKNKFYAALFLIVFAITSSMASWDFIMSVDPHWYSTLFGWYNFASYTGAGVAAITLIVVYLKSNGYLQMVTEDHWHNLGLFMFGFSVFWAYLWFSQYMLIWYGNIPEETFYYYNRLKESTFFNVLFYANLIINFFIPFLILMTRSAKRSLATLTMVALVMLFGHWLDFYLMIMPGSVGAEAGIGLLEFSILAGFAGAFIYVVLNTLTKASLVPVNNPYLKESLHHHTLK